MSLRFHEISEGDHRILDPIGPEKLALVGRVCGLTDASTVVDLCCGKAELLAMWHEAHGIAGIGVDLSPVFVAAARTRLEAAGATGQIEIVEGEAAAWARERHAAVDQGEAERADVVCCVGATWIGGGFGGTLDLLLPLVRPGGYVVVGECHRHHDAPEHLTPAGALDEFVPLASLLDVAEAHDLELVEMVLANTDEWDRYVAAQWHTVDRYLAAHPDDPEAADLHAWIADSRRAYLTWQRDSIGWGIFVMRAPTAG